MKFLDNTIPKRIIADEGKHIKSVDDIYVPEYIDEDGNLVPEHTPYYSTIIFVPDNFIEEQMYKLYIEENII